MSLAVRRPRAIELAVVGAVAAVVLLAFALVPSYPGLDGYYDLVWGRELAHGQTPSFDSYRAPTHHPLYVVVGALLSLAGQHAERLLVLFTLLSLVAFLYGLYRLGTALFGRLGGALATLFAAQSVSFTLYAARGFVDVPFLALVVWAAALEAERPRRGTAPMALLALAGLLRPEAWLFALLYYCWLRYGGPRGRARPRLAGLAVVAPLLWCAVDWAATGDPLFSLHSTSSLADELRHSGGAAQVPGAFVSFLAFALRPPVAALGVIGIGLALWRRGAAALALPLGLFAAGTLAFALTGLVGLSVLPRYLTVPAAMLCVFAAYPLAGCVDLARDDPWRRRWLRASTAVAVLGLAGALVLAPASVRKVRRELRFIRDSHDQLAALLRTPQVTAGLRCGPLTLPSDRLIADSRWLLHAPPRWVLTRAPEQGVVTHDPRQGPQAYGVAIYVSGSKPIKRFGHAAGIPHSTNVTVAPGFVVAARNGAFTARVRCPGA
ncbi:MAG TPA: hypothetical protein VHE14_06700 [Solirubrobacteraceae bacterium]|nr:hypothetical protein [Solirubrobacteraceae bacterium]